MAYVPKAMKKDINQVRANDPNLTMSRQIYEALEEWLPKQLGKAKQNPSRPSRTSPKQ
jgi:hypothetical protein